MTTSLSVLSSGSSHKRFLLDGNRKRKARAKKTCRAAPVQKAPTGGGDVGRKRQAHGRRAGPSRAARAPRAERRRSRPTSGRRIPLKELDQLDLSNMPRLHRACVRADLDRSRRRPPVQRAAVRSTTAGVPGFGTAVGVEVGKNVWCAESRFHHTVPAIGSLTPEWVEPCVSFPWRRNWASTASLARKALEVWRRRRGWRRRAAYPGG